MATHHGKEGVVKIGANTVAEVSDFSIQQEADVADDTQKSDAWDTHLIGRNKWSADVTAHWDETDTNGQQAMTAGASVTLNLYPEGADAGDTYFTGTATIISINIGSPLSGTVSATFRAQGNGILTKMTV